MSAAHASPVPPAFYSPLAAGVGGALNWTFFATGPVLAGFDTVTPIEIVTELWRAASAPDASIEAIVAAIPTRGADAVESFVVVFVGERVTVVTRGSGSVDIVGAQGQRRIDSRQMQPWYLAEFDGVSALSLGSDARPVGVVTQPDHGDLPLQSGLVRAPWLGWTPQRDERTSARSAATASGDSFGAPNGMAAVIPQHQPSLPITGSIPVQNLAAAPGPYRSPISAPIPVIPVSPNMGPLPPLPLAPATPRDHEPLTPSGGPAPIDLDDTVGGVGTGRWSLLAESEADSGTAASSPFAAADAPDAEFGDTIVIERQKHRADVPTVTAWSPGRLELDPRFGAGGAERHIGYYSMRIGDGPVYRLDTPVYIGRKPSSPRIVTGTIPRLLKVSSPSMEVSGTHVELRQEGTSVVVTDMRSTNGTFVSQPGAAHVKLRQGESLVVTPGTLVDIGDGNVIEILPIR